MKIKITHKLESFLNYLKNKLTNKNLKEDIARKQLILNILIFVSIISFLFFNIIRIIDLIISDVDRGMPLIYTLAILAFFIFLAFLSKKGKIKLAAWLMIIVYSLPMIYSFILWGADLPAALLMSVLIIAFCGLLINSITAVIVTIIINLGLVLLTYLHNQKIIVVKNYWRAEEHQIGDAITYAILLLAITILVALAIREINYALKKARLSEEALQKERDDLEIKVIERTKLLKQAESEKMNQLYRLAEFGRLSSGIFHDLINPLTALSLNLEQIKNSSDTKLESAETSLSQAINASHKMEDLITCIKRSIKKEGLKETFKIHQEIETSIKLLNYKLRQGNIIIHVTYNNQITYQGDAVKFGQIITNLICNAIDSLENSQQVEKIITINCQKILKKAIIKIQDNGPGIEAKNIEKIFEPFFSTKKEKGLGLGLSSVKHLVETDFKGKIEVKSQPYQKTTFIIILPLNI